jgi:hypothetical protein
MSRYYFYHANWYANSAAEDAPPSEGEVHGIWIVEDASTPDTILSAIEAWLYDEWDKQRLASAAPGAGSRSASFFITQFNNVQ